MTLSKDGKCYNLPHLYFTEQKRDIHHIKDNSQWEYCNKNICPNWLNIKHDKSYDWSEPCEEAEVLAYRQAEESSEEEDNELVEEPQQESKEDTSQRTLQLPEQNEEEGNKAPLATEEITWSLSQQLEKVNLNKEHTLKPEMIKIPSTAPWTNVSH